MRFLTRIVASVSAALVLMVAGAPAKAAFPDHPVRVLVGYGAGGGLDIVTRVIAQALSAKWGQQVIVENRAGADGTIAAEFVARAKPDGYTLLFMPADFTVAANVYKINYHPIDSFAAVGRVATTPDVLIVHPSLPVNNLQDLVNLVKANPGQYDYGTGGKASFAAMVMQDFARSMGLKMNQIPYNGTGPAMVALLGGEIKTLFLAMPTAIPHINSGKAKALAVSSKERVKLLPNVPTVSEAANLPVFEGDLFYGVLAPAGTPNDIITKIHDDIIEVMKAPNVVKLMDEQGFTPAGSSSAEFTQLLTKEIARWGALLEATKDK